MKSFFVQSFIIIYTIHYICHYSLRSISVFYSLVRCDIHPETAEVPPFAFSQIEFSRSPVQSLYPDKIRNTIAVQTPDPIEIFTPGHMTMPYIKSATVHTSSAICLATDSIDWVNFAFSKRIFTTSASN